MIYPETNAFHPELEIPKGYKFAGDAIKDVSIDNTLVNILYRTCNSDDKLILNGSYSFKKAVYQPDEYYELKKMFNIIIETFNGKIILQKIE
jgi:hypothetical protein